MLLTIFTPTYNRAYTLPKLFDSLKSQTSKDFEWLIVDDGSTDETEMLIRDYRLQAADCSQQKQGFEIRYFKQENGGKHRAINRGLEEAKGELFFIVDSDDRLTEYAVEWIIKNAALIMEDSKYAGLSGLRIRPDGVKIGGGDDFGTIDATALDIRNVHHVKGDLAEVFKTEIFRKYPFPDIKGEKFCSEGLIWGRMAGDGLKIRYIYKGIYVCEYLNDGLTEARFRLRRDNPEYSMLLDSEGVTRDVPFLDKVRQAINFWRYSEKSKKRFIEKCRQIGFRWVWLYPAGIFFRIVKI